MERVGAGDRTSWWADGGGDRHQALGDPFPWPGRRMSDSLGMKSPFPVGAFVSTEGSESAYGRFNRGTGLPTPR